MFGQNETNETIAQRRLKSQDSGPKDVTGTSPTSSTDTSSLSSSDSPSFSGSASASASTSTSSAPPSPRTLTPLDEMKETKKPPSPPRIIKAMNALHDETQILSNGGDELCLSESVKRGSKVRLMISSGEAEQTGEGFKQMVEAIIADRNIGHIDIMICDTLHRFKLQFLNDEKRVISLKEAYIKALELGESFEKDKVNAAAIEKLKRVKGENNVTILHWDFYPTESEDYKACYSVIEELVNSSKEREEEKNREKEKEIDKKQWDKAEEKSSNQKVKQLKKSKKSSVVQGSEMAEKYFNISLEKQRKIIGQKKLKFYKNLAQLINNFTDATIRKLEKLRIEGWTEEQVRLAERNFLIEESVKRLWMLLQHGNDLVHAEIYRHKINSFMHDIQTLFEGTYKGMVPITFNTKSNIRPSRAESKFAENITSSDEVCYRGNKRKTHRIALLMMDVDDNTYKGILKSFCLAKGGEGEDSLSSKPSGTSNMVGGIDVSRCRVIPTRNGGAELIKSFGMFSSAMSFSSTSISSASSSVLTTTGSNKNDNNMSQTTSTSSAGNTATDANQKNIQKNITS